MSIKKQLQRKSQQFETLKNIFGFYDWNILDAKTD